MLAETLNPSYWLLRFLIPSGVLASRGIVTDDLRILVRQKQETRIRRWEAKVVLCFVFLVSLFADDFNLALSTVDSHMRRWELRPSYTASDSKKWSALKSTKKSRGMRTENLHFSASIRKRVQTTEYHITKAELC